MLPKRSTTRGPAEAHGFTLIEVLVTLLVLSIGLVGIAALHLTSLKNAHSSYYTSIASSIALDFEERLWLKVAAKQPGDCITQTDVETIVADLETLWAWSSSEPHAVSLPGLKLAVPPELTANGAPWREVSLTVSWTETRFEGLNESEDNGDVGNTDPRENFNYLARVVCWPDAPEDQANDGET